MKVPPNKKTKQGEICDSEEEDDDDDGEEKSKITRRNVNLKLVPLLSKKAKQTNAALPETRNGLSNRSSMGTSH